MKNNIFNPFEKKIIRTLYDVKIPISAYEVGKLTGMSWGTARKYSKNLLQRNIIIKNPKNEIKFNFNLLRGTNPNFRKLRRF